MPPSIGRWSIIPSSSTSCASSWAAASFSVPASIEVVEDAGLRELFDTFWTAGEFAAVDRMKLFKLAWDLIGSDHASRAASYEKFFVGPAFAVRNYNFINAPWDELHAVVEEFMSTYGVDEGGLAGKEPARRQAAR